jgi:hypothetical protein
MDMENLTIEEFQKILDDLDGKSYDESKIILIDILERMSIESALNIKKNMIISSKDRNILDKLLKEL